MLIKLESTAKVVAKEEEDNLTKREGDKEEIVTLKDEEIGMRPSIGRKYPMTPPS